MPVEQGEYQYPFGGPFDAKDELVDEFAALVNREVVEALAIRLRGETPNWAPTVDQMPSEDDAPDDWEYADDGPSLTGEDERESILRRLEAAEDLLKRLLPPHGGIGHNQPPAGPLSKEEQQGALDAVAVIRDELHEPEPNRKRIFNALRMVSRAAKAVTKWSALNNCQAADLLGRVAELGAPELQGSVGTMRYSCDSGGHEAPFPPG